MKAIYDILITFSIMRVKGKFPRSVHKKVSLERPFQ